MSVVTVGSKRTATDYSDEEAVPSATEGRSLAEVGEFLYSSNISSSSGNSLILSVDLSDADVEEHTKNSQAFSESNETLFIWHGTTEYTNIGVGTKGSKTVSNIDNCMTGDDRAKDRNTQIDQGSNAACSY